MTTPSADNTTRPRTPAAWFFLIFGVTLLAYYPALHAGFIWDDHPGHVTRPELQSVAGLARIWFEPGATQQYYPLLHSAFWLEHRLWGEAAAGYHLVNVLLHALAACLIAKLLFEVGRGVSAEPSRFAKSKAQARPRLAATTAHRDGSPDRLAPWLAALLFALHPVCVESVAWISEQKNTLSAVLHLGAALAFLRYDETRARKHHVIATVLFVLALLTKTVTATLPAALLVIAWWRRGRIDLLRDVLPLLPWFVLSLTAGAVTASFEHAQIGAQGGDFALGPLERVLLAGRAVWFYLGKLLWPAKLAFIYPRWTIAAGEAWQWLFPLAAIAGLAALWKMRRKTRAPLAAALLFAGTLFPALGFVNVFPFIYSFVADHFQYLASIPVFAFAAAALSALPPRAFRIAAAIVLVTLAALTSRQTKIYRDVFTLYEDTLAKNPGAWMAHNNLAIALVDAGRPAEAIPHYEQALKLRPNFAEAENNLGYALTQLGRDADALPHLERALQLQPRYAEAQNNRGRALMNLGRADEGIAAFTEAIRLKPDYALAHVNLGLALARNHRPAEALPHFQRAAQLDPNYADAELNWGIALVVTNKISEALPHFERALQLNPRSAEAHTFYARALAAAGRYDEAGRHNQTARELSGR